MDFDIAAATDFLAGHGRLLDRRRFARIVGGDDTAGVLTALEAYRNADGGYGWGIEPDLRSTTSQTVAALHAFEAIADAAPTTTSRSDALCDWLLDHTLADGGVPFALPIPDPIACSPFWTDADSTVSSLQITSAVACKAHEVARHDPVVADHPWLAHATQFCLGAIERLGPEPHAYEVSFALQFLDAVPDDTPGLGALVDRLGAHLEPDGSMAVTGGVEGEVLRLLDFSSRPGKPSRRALSDDAVRADLKRLAAEQESDGGWTVGFETSSPAAALEWRGYATVKAVATLLAHEQ